METTTCNVRLPCGHQCPLDFHPNVDPNHDNFRCEKPCQKTKCTAPLKHECKLLCYQECQPCDTLIDKHYHCGHIHKTMCKNMSMAHLPCDVLVKKKFPCGHKYKVCCKDAARTQRCMQIIIKELPCRHRASVACSVKLATNMCTKKCNKTLPLCGHPCQRMCKDKCGECEVIVEKTKQCGCKYGTKCHEKLANESCEKCDLKLNPDNTFQFLCLSILACVTGAIGMNGGVFIVGLLFSIYFYRVLFDVKRNPPLKPLTDHVATVQPACLEVLPCGHVCRGKYWTCWQGRVHQSCSVRLGRISAFCGHTSDTLCGKALVPCERDCPHNCEHSRCSLRCADPCIPCIETCQWQCKHHKCKLLCWEFCVRPRCNKPCSLKLACGHRCIGLCGEKCPSLCRICDHDELGEFMLSGKEDDEGARFIQLNGCGHCIEVNGMDKWMDEKGREVQMKRCPRCKAIIWSSRRYSNVIRRCKQDIEKVKMKLLGGSNEERKRKMDALFSRARDVSGRSTVSEEISVVRNDLSSGFVLSTGRLTVIENQLNTLVFMKNMKMEANHLMSSAANYVTKEVKKLSERLMKNKESLTEFELQQIHREVKRVCLFANAMNAQGRLDSTDSLTMQKRNLLRQISNMFQVDYAFTDDDEAQVERMLKACNVPIGISIREMVMIKKAMILDQGNWYKCANGHVYAIGECGQPMQTGKCPECNSTIGGRNHALEEGNIRANWWW